MSKYNIGSHSARDMDIVMIGDGSVAFRIYTVIAQY